jgi:hypothetical protein
MEVINVVGSFALKSLVIEERASKRLHPDDVTTAVRKHLAADWGEANEQLRQQNELSLRENAPITSIFTDRAGNQFVICTSGDRTLTRVKLGPG